jgi:Protein of unknown function (DUF1289)
MKFTPCADLCTSDGTHCQGCGRSHPEIAETKKLIASVVTFIQTQQYENPDIFLEVLNKKVLKKVQKTV